jgi:hypothetical protein
MGMMQGFNPASLSPVLWVNPYVDSYVTTIDNNGVRQRGNIIDSATASTGQSLTTAGTLISKPIYNGEGWMFQAGVQLSTGSVSDYNFIHDGSDFDIWCTVFICPTTNSTYQRGFICNNGFSTTARGILLRANSTGNNRLDCNIGNGTQSFITLGANSVLTVNATQVIRVTRSGATARMFVNGTQVATQTIVLAPGVGNAASVMQIATALAATANVYMKDVFVENRALTVSEAANMNARIFPSITPEPINVYLFAGDSNCAGRGSNAAIAPDLVGNIAGTSAETFSSVIDASSWIGKLLLGTNQTLPSENPTTQHGSEMRFGKSMGAAKEDFILKCGLGSNTVFQRANNALSDFNVNTVNSSYSRFTTTIIPTALFDLVHSYRKTPVFRGFLWIEGANDALFGAQGVSWTRVGTTITVISINHGMTTPDTLGFYDSSDLTTIPIANYSITRIDASTFTIIGVNTGATSGTLSYAGGYFYKQNVYNVVNGLIDVLQLSIKNQVTNGNGYTVNKLRLYFPQTAGTGLNAASLAFVQAAQTDMGANYLTDNPSRAVNVLGSFSESTASIPRQDGVHYTTAGYDTLGSWEYNYFSSFINE